MFIEFQALQYRSNAGRVIKSTFVSPQKKENIMTFHSYWGAWGGRGRTRRSMLVIDLEIRDPRSRAQLERILGLTGGSKACLLATSIKAHALKGWFANQQVRFRLEYASAMLRRVDLDVALGHLE